MRAVAISLVLPALACSRGAAGNSASLDAGPPPHPPFYEFEGLKWGMTPAEVAAVWGPGEDGQAYRYARKGGYVDVSLGYMSVPSDSIKDPALEAVARAAGRVELLVFVALRPESETSAPKDQVRADLVSRFGPPLEDPALLASLDCKKGACEVFRAAECTVVKADWAPAFAELKWPDRLNSLTYELAPGHLVAYVPRGDWGRLRGAVRASYTADLRARIDGFASSGPEAATVEQIVKALGPPNLHRPVPDGTAALDYLFLDGSLQSLRIRDGRLTGWEGVRN
jgi:hypothetical protein